MIKDHNGKTPNFIIQDGYLIHQPTGTTEKIDYTDSNYYRTLRNAHRKLKRKLP